MLAAGTGGITPERLTRGFCLVNQPSRSDVRDDTRALFGHKYQSDRFGMKFLEIRKVIRGSGPRLKELQKDDVA